MKSKLGRPPLIQIDFNEVNKCNPGTIANTHNHLASFSTQLAQHQALKEGGFINSPTPNFISPSNKQHQQSSQSGTGSQFFSQMQQQQASLQSGYNTEMSNPNFEQQYGSHQEKYFSNESEPITISQQQQSSLQSQGKQEQAFQMNTSNSSKNLSHKRNSCSPNMVNNYYKRIKEFVEVAKHRKFQQYANNRQSYESNPSNRNQQDYQEYQQHMNYKTERDVSPQIKRNNSTTNNSSSLTNARLKQIAQSNKSLVRNSSSSNIAIQPQRISVDMSEFMVKKPPQPPSNRTPSGGDNAVRQSTPSYLNNVYHNLNENTNLLNLTPKASHTKTTSSKSPSHKKTKSLLDFIKNGISNSTKNINKTNENGKQSNQKKQKQQQNTTFTCRNSKSVGRKESQMNQLGNQTMHFLKGSIHNPCTNRSGASTTAHTISPLISPNILGQQNQSLHISNFDSKNLDKSFTKFPSTTQASNQSNPNLHKFPSSTKNSSSQNGQINENGILFKNSTKTLAIKQKVISERLKEKQSQKEDTRYVTEADQVLQEEDEEGMNDDFFIKKSKRGKSKEESAKKSHPWEFKNESRVNTVEDDKTTLSYRQMMIAQAQIGKEHPTPSQIKFLQSNQKKNYFDKIALEDASCIVERQDTDFSNNSQFLPQQNKFYQMSNYSPSKLESNLQIQNHCQENLEESFSAQHNCHSMQRAFSSSIINGLASSKDNNGSVGSVIANNTLPLSQNTLNSTKNHSNYQTNQPSNINNQTLPSTIENDSLLHRNQFNFFSNQTTTATYPLTTIQFKQTNSQMVDNYNHPSDSTKSKTNESMQTSSEKHLKERYPLFFENSDTKEMGAEQKNNLEQQYQSLYNPNQQNQAIPITKMNPLYTENYLIPSSSNRILQQLNTYQNNQQLNFKKQTLPQSIVPSVDMIANQNISNSKNALSNDAEQSVIAFQISQDTNLQQNQQKQPSSSIFYTQRGNNDINELSFEAKNIEPSQRNMSCLETNTLYSNLNNNMNGIQGTSNFNLSSSYIYNQGFGLSTPNKQNQTKSGVSKVIDNASIPVSTQLVQQQTFGSNKKSNSRNSSPQHNQVGRVSRHQLSPTSNLKLKLAIENRSLSLEKALNTQIPSNVPQNKKEIILPGIQDSQQPYLTLNYDQVSSSLQSTPYQIYNNQYSLSNTQEKQNIQQSSISQNNQKNLTNNLFQESFSQFQNQQTSVGTDRQAVHLMTSPKQQSIGFPLNFQTSDCSSYRIDPLYQQQVNQYTQKSTQVAIIPETIDLQRMQTDQSLFESQQKLKQVNTNQEKSKTIKIEGDVSDNLLMNYQTNQSSKNNQNSVQQIGSQIYQNKFFHPIDVNSDQKENNSHLNNNGNCPEVSFNQMEQGRQLESQYLMKRLYQVQKEQQQQHSSDRISSHNQIDQSKLDRSYITTTEELGAELQENKLQSHRLQQQLQYMENRIRKLVYEDDNLEKRIQNINQKREDLSLVKMKSQEDNQRLQNLKQRQHDQIKEMKRKISQGRIQSKERLEKSKMQSQLSKKQIANSVKDQNTMNKSLVEETRNQEAMRNSFIINSVKNLEKKLIEEKTNKAVNALQQSKISQMTKIDEEREEQLQMQNKIQELEYLELQLIENLEQKYEKNKNLLYI